MSDGIVCEALPDFAVCAVLALLPRPLGGLPAAAEVPAEVAAFAGGPGIDAALRTAVRDVLRQRGYRPTGRGKPSSEYLANAAAEGRWPLVNVVVDAGNLASLRHGLPISVVDADLAQPPWTVRCGADGERYVFNSGGQEIDLGGLPCLCDRDGPCANAVKDSQRTKTTAATVRVLAIVWGCSRPDAGLPERTLTDLERRLQAIGAMTTRVPTA